MLSIMIVYKKAPSPKGLQNRVNHEGGYYL